MPLQGAVPKWLREQSAKLRCGGSNPPGASNIAFLTFNWLSGCLPPLSDSSEIVPPGQMRFLNRL